MKRILAKAERRGKQSFGKADLRNDSSSESDNGSSDEDVEVERVLSPRR